METTKEERKVNPTRLFKGYCIDLLNTLRGTLHFDYTLYLVADGSYGTQDITTGEWNGIMGDIVTGVSHSFRIAAIT